MKLSGFRSWHFCQVAADTEDVRLLGWAGPEGRLSEWRFGPQSGLSS
jgi:hypothetical protein